MTGSLLFITNLFGTLLSGTLQKQLGRKRCSMIANIPSLIGWILLYRSYSSITLCLSTSMVGFSIGFSCTVVQLYTGEITEPRLRGRLASSSGMAVMIGSSLIYILDYVFYWRNIALINACCSIICLCLISLVCTTLLYLHLLDSRNACFRLLLFMPFCLLDSGVSSLVDSAWKKR